MTKIEWTDESWNPVTGCTKIGAGCKNCYAERHSKRLAGAHGYPPTPDNFKVTLHPDRMNKPLSWKKPRMVFVCSMGDLFHEDVPDDFIEKVFWIMEEARQHTFQILTKRPERMHQFHNVVKQRVLNITNLPNVWLGTSVSNQADAEANIPWLLKTPATVRFVSFEPALEFVDFTPYMKWTGDDLNSDVPGIDWLICGGESGPGARPMHPIWAQGARHQCVRSNIPFFFKQWGTWYPMHHRHKLALPENKNRVKEIGGGYVAVNVGKKKAGRELDGRTWDEMPEVHRGN